MKRAIRTQVDDKFDAYSDATALVFLKDDPKAKSRTRQEYKQESDTNYILSRFGVDVPQRRVVFGESDDQLDLQKAHEAVVSAKIAHHRMPKHLRDKYPHWKSLLNAVFSGELKSLDEVAPPPKPKETDASTSGTAAADSSA